MVEQLFSMFKALGFIPSNTHTLYRGIEPEGGQSATSVTSLSNLGAWLESGCEVLRISLS